MAFAQDLTKIVVRKKHEQRERSSVAEKWIEHETKLLDRAVKLFRQRCTREAQQQRCEMTVSFEVLSREIDGFPSHTMNDSTYVVDSWGNGVSAESWYYATRGTTASWSPGAPVLYAEMLESMMPKFLDRAKSLGFSTCAREPGTWKVHVSWPAPKDLPEDFSFKNCSFAQSLTKHVMDVKEELGSRQQLANKWLAFESKLLDRAIELFKERCLREAQMQRCEATVSFEVLSREIQGFPTRMVKDSTYHVDVWGDDITSEAWYYATRGPAASWSPGAPVLFAEVLEGMIPKFVDKLKPLGFQGCNREAGTWTA